MNLSRIHAIVFGVVFTVVAVGLAVLPARPATADTITIAAAPAPRPIQNRNSGACMVVVPSSTQTFVDANPCSEPQFISTFAQTSAPPASIPGHTYHQLAASAAGAQLFPGTPAEGCLDVPNQRSGTLLIVTPCANATAGQYWTVISHSGGGVIYANLGSGKCMAQHIADSTTGSGAVFQTNCDESSAVWLTAV